MPNCEQQSLDDRSVKRGLEKPVLEVAILDVKLGCEKAFESDFKEAQKIISAMKGYISHTISRCVEAQNRYILLVNWNKLEDHTVGFRESDQYQQWRSLLHHYYEPFPTVEHYYAIDDN